MTVPRKIWKAVALPPKTPALENERLLSSALEDFQVSETADPDKKVDRLVELSVADQPSCDDQQSERNLFRDTLKVRWRSKNK